MTRRPRTVRTASRIGSLGLLVMACPVASQTLVGRVLDSTSGAPVAGVKVVAKSVDAERVLHTFSDESGNFSLSPEWPGTYSLQFERIGYSETASIEILLRRNLTTSAQFYLAPAAVDLEPIRVLIEPKNRYLQSEGFYERLERGIGKFMDPEDVENYPREPLHRQLE